jgi:hypothetical protein
MADNEGAVHDPDSGGTGDFPDWIEIHNPGTETVDLGGLHLTDDLNDPTRFRIADGISLEAGDFLLFWADNDTEQGNFHANFALNADGEAVGLFGAEGTVQVDAVTFPGQMTNVSYGRLPDDPATWNYLVCFSPGEANDSCYAVFLPLVAK